MNRPRRARSARGWLRHPVRELSVAALAVSLLTVGFAPAVAVADPGATLVTDPGRPAPVAAGAPRHPDGNAPMAPADRAPDPAVDKAIRAAHASGRPVPVDALTTATRTVTANPSGTVTVDQHVLPVRVRRAGSWVPVDPTLRANTDGSYSPRASWAPVRLSGGGDAPMVTLTSGTASLALSWPGRLPAPHVSGATATYTGVLPGVDLQLTATGQSGVTEVLVVHDARAAANPALDAVTLGVTAHGVTVSADAGGNLRAADAHGQVLFTAPTPRMWDSAAAPAGAAPPPGVSTAAQPGQGARVTPLATRLTGGTLRLSPDLSLLRGAATRYPVFLDPSWNPVYADGARQAFDEIQQGCPNTSNWNSTQYSGDPAVGYNSFSGCLGKERSFFQVAVPSIVWDSHIVSATVNTVETYSSSCAASSDVYLWWYGAISSATTWNHPPSPQSNLGSQKVGPACTSQPAVGYPVTSTMVTAAAGHWTSWTFGLINGDESSGIYRKRFETNPYVEIEYNHVPAVPASLSAAVGADSVGCATATPYPLMGSTVATTPPVLSATVADVDGGLVQGTFSYWVDGSSTRYTLTSTVSSGGSATVSLPSSFAAALTTGQVVDWQVRATDGEDTSVWSSTCHFQVDLSAPPPPAITSVDGLFPPTSSGTTGAPAGTTGQFGLASASGASTFVYQLDAVPPTSNPGASQKVTATGDAATVTATPLAPGAHTLWSYALDQAGNESGVTGYTFTVAGHQNVTYPNLPAAFNNVAISADTAPGAANADGAGASLSMQDLQAAGWQPGGQVTVDGATFTLPTFGNGAPDNVLAANQTITMPAGSHGDALVFLATATAAKAADPGVIPGDVTSPYVPAGTGIAGTGCTFTNGTAVSCQPASGAISYGGGAPAQSYQLTVPDWIAGPRTVAAVQLPHLNNRSGQTGSSPKIFTFAVPLNPNAPVASVTLPDVSNSVAQAGMPGLHILGMAVRDTTTAPGNARWTGAWSAPNEGAFNYLGGASYGNQTFRVTAAPSVAGGSVRVRLSDALGTTPLVIDHVTLGIQGSGAATTATPVNLTFGGASGTTIPIGAEMYSDPVSYPVNTNQRLVVSVHLVNSLTYLVQHSWAAATTMWVSPVGSGDHTADSTSSAFTATGSHWGYFTDIVTDIDVTAAGNPGTVAVLGGNLTRATASGMTAVVANRVPVSTGLATALRGNTQGVPDFGVIDAGIEDNGVLRDVLGGAGGVSALARLDRDILARPGIGTVIVTEGLTDLLNGTGAETLTSVGYTELATQLNAWGISVVFASLTPCDGYGPCGTGVDTARVTANNWLSDQTTYLAPYVSNVDFSAAVAIDDPTSTTTPAEQKLDNGVAPGDDDSGDHVNLTNDGFAALTATIPLTDLVDNTPPEY